MTFLKINVSPKNSKNVMQICNTTSNVIRLCNKIVQNACLYLQYFCKIT